MLLLVRDRAFGVDCYICSRPLICKTFFVLERLFMALNPVTAINHSYAILRYSTQSRYWHSLATA